MLQNSLSVSETNLPEEENGKEKQRRMYTK